LPTVAGKILLLKELVEVENVPCECGEDEAGAKKREEGPRGYVVKGNKLRESPWDI
jgi:hypothetical protein